MRSGESIIVCKDIWSNYGNQKDVLVPATSYDEDEEGEDEDDWSSGGFNGIELQLTENDIEWLEEAIKNQELPETSGFFFGSDSYTWNEEGYAEDEIQENYYYKQMDLQFVENAKEALKEKI